MANTINIKFIIIFFLPTRSSKTIFSRKKKLFEYQKQNKNNRQVFFKLNVEIYEFKIDAKNFIC